MGGVPHLAAGNAFLPSQKLPLQVKEGEEEKDEDGGGKILFDSFLIMIRPNNFLNFSGIAFRAHIIFKLFVFHFSPYKAKK